jgi:hypothetical protein
MALATEQSHQRSSTAASAGSRRPPKHRLSSGMGEGHSTGPTTYLAFDSSLRGLAHPLTVAPAQDDIRSVDEHRSLPHRAADARRQIADARRYTAAGKHHRVIGTCRGTDVARGNLRRMCLAGETHPCPWPVRRSPGPCMMSSSRCSDRTKGFYHSGPRGLEILQPHPSIPDWVVQRDPLQGGTLHLPG